MIPESSRFPSSSCWIQRVQEPGSGPAPAFDYDHPDVHSTRCEAISRIDQERIEIETTDPGERSNEQYARLVVLDLVIERVVEAERPEDLIHGEVLNQISGHSQSAVWALAGALLAAGK